MPERTSPASASRRIDGSIGKIDKATDDTTGNTLVVDTGPWIFGKKVMLPGGVIDRIDRDEEKVYVNRTKDEIKSSPEYDDSMYEDEAYRGELAGYYGPAGAATATGRSRRRVDARSPDAAD